MTVQGVDPFLLALFLAALSLMPMLMVVCTAWQPLSKIGRAHV